MLVFLGSETMFFAGLVSAFLILRAGSPAWPPPGQPRLPVAVSAVNTLILFASGFAVRQAVRSIRADLRLALTRWLAVTALLGGTFLAVQGSEWIRLLRFGLSFTSSLYGATFYTLIGVHGLHAAAGLAALLVVLRRAANGLYCLDDHCGVEVCSLYWCFVVLVWPVLYVIAYLL